jgi:phosphatidate cytidylyltransferase
VLLVLATATMIGQFLKRQRELGINPALVQQFNSRIRAWWLMCSVLAAAFLLGPASRVTTVVIFGFISFWALREFITLTPTRLGDHRALFWVFFLFTPLQYYLISAGVYGLYTVLIPVYGFLFIPARIALAGDYKRFSERVAKIQAALMICVYCLSHAPAILYLDDGDGSIANNARLLFFLVLIAQLNDVLQYGWGKLLGKRVIAPAINPSRTWEGFVGGLLSSGLLGLALYWATPYSNPIISAGMAMVIAVMGFAGGMTMSAIKRDRGVRDYGTLVTGHGGVLDRIDSICFAAPVFFHLTRLYFAIP